MVKILLKTQESPYIIFPISIMHKYNEYDSLEDTDNMYFNLYSKDNNYVIFRNNIPRYNEKLIELLEESIEYYDDHNSNASINEYENTYSIVDFPATIEELDQYCIVHISTQSEYVNSRIEFIIPKTTASFEMYSYEANELQLFEIRFEDFEGNAIQT